MVHVVAARHALYRIAHGARSSEHGRSEQAVDAVLSEVENHVLGIRLKPVPSADGGVRYAQLEK
eukprot:4431342-Pyramimonas_sp.AAC.1